MEFILYLIAVMTLGGIGWALFRRALEKRDPNALFALAVKAARSRRMDLAFETFQRAAEQGHAESQFNVGLMYMEGVYVQKNPAMAADWFTKSAALGMPQAQYNLGVMFSKGLGVPRDQELARRWLGAAAAHGMAPARDMLGTLAPMTTFEADSYDQSAPTEELLPTQLRLDYRQERYLKIFGSNNDPKPGDEQVYTRVVAQSKTGDAQAQALAGVLMYNRSDSDVGRDAARTLLNRAVQQGHTHAQHLVTRLAPDSPTAGGGNFSGAGAIWDAAHRGDMNAQFELGGRYRRGEDVQEELALSTRWFQKAEAQGHQEAAFCLAMAYLHGWGIERDAPRAAEMFRQLAERGDRDAAHWLGTLYLVGDGVAHDRAKSEQWSRRAAELGDPDAQFQVGLDCSTAENRDSDDLERSMAWWRKAAEQGHVAAAELIEEMTNNLEPTF